VKIKLAMVLGLTFLFFGCASTQQPSNLNQIQIKLAQMERKVDENSKKIDEMDYTVQELSSQVEGLETYSNVEPVVENDYQRGSRQMAESKAADDKGIIRVSASVQDLQKALKAAGYYEGAVDGKIGAGTKKAIKDFQKDHDLTADGIVGGAYNFNGVDNYISISH